MGAVKINSADKAFSDAIRALANWHCERCGGCPDRRGLHCSHFHGRGKWSVRFDPLNATSLCMGCHLLFTSHPYDHREFQHHRLGPYAYEALQERANDTSLGRRMKREQRAITAHYREQLRDIQSMLELGESPVIVGYE